MKKLTDLEIYQTCFPNYCHHCHWLVLMQFEVMGLRVEAIILLNIHILDCS